MGTPVFNHHGWYVGYMATDKDGFDNIVCPRQPWTAYKLPDKSCGHDWVFLSEPEVTQDGHFVPSTSRHGSAYCKRKGCKARATFSMGVIESYDSGVRDR